VSGLDRFDKTVLGERLRVARSGAGLTQDLAAKHIGVARTTLVAIEAGQRAIRPEEFLNLAKLYGMSANALLRPDAVQVDVVAQFRRVEPARGWSRPVAEAQRTLQRLAASCVELEQMLGVQTVAKVPIRHVVARSQVDEQAADVAMELRNRLGLGLAPIPDVLGLIEAELGVRVFVRALDSTIAGLYAAPEGVGPCMLINAKHPRTRRAMSGGHELGHALSRPEVPEVLLLDQEEDALHERFAVQFGLAWIMPAPAIRRRFGELRDERGFSVRHLILLANQFHVSLEAMGRRLEQLGLLEAGKYDALKARGLSEKTVREVLGQEAEDAPPTVPQRFTLLAVEAHSRGLLTEGQLAEMLLLDRLQVRALIDAFGGEEGDLL
jgi:Zn-dependent peptidase ImmA (M78 family)/DNA-binding XRE family transcriptional regulator